MIERGSATVDTAGGLLGGLYRDGLADPATAAFGQPPAVLTLAFALFVAGRLPATPGPAGLFCMLAAGLPFGRAGVGLPAGNGRLACGFPAAEVPYAGRLGSTGDAGRIPGAG